MPSWLRGPEQGFVRPFCFRGDVPVSKSGTVFYRGFLDLDSSGHDPGSVRPPFGSSWSIFSVWGFPNVVYLYHSLILSCPPLFLVLSLSRLLPPMQIAIFILTYLLLCVAEASKRRFWIRGCFR